jgi:hypothetical protein
MYSWSKLLGEGGWVVKVEGELAPSRLKHWLSPLNGLPPSSPSPPCPHPHPPSPVFFFFFSGNSFIVKS